MLNGVLQNKLIPFFNNFKREKIIIYPNLSGFILGAFVFFCFLISVFYENNFALLISIIIFFIFFISIIISNQNLTNIDYVSSNELLIEANRESSIQLNIFNNSQIQKLNIDFYIDKKFKGNFDLELNNNSINLNLFKQTRGSIPINDLQLKSDFPFGIINTIRKFKLNNTIYVYPKPKKQNLELLAKFNLDNSLQNQEEFNGIDQYKIGDNLSKIAWKQSIGKNKKYIKSFKSNHSKQKILDLNEYPNIDFEELLSTVTFIFLEHFKLKKEISLKHKDQLFKLTTEKPSLNKILIYLSHVQN
ncbi:hypothetical protein [Candidatus Pelagibacter sp. HIMB1483]|uniref:hypothetical protein n=1 Tax=Candidatus Pelagibacter sp. HIMB1483 TaxID=3415414 RepID=UPI003F82C8B1